MVAISLGMSDRTSLSDEELVQRFKEGDALAFDEIVRRHRGRIFNVVYRVLNNRQDAEEITNDAFIRAHRKLSALRGDSSLGSWLHRVAINAARNRYWRNMARRYLLHDSIHATSGETGSETVGDRIPSKEPLPTEQIEHDELASLVAVNMARLTPRHREILVLRNEFYKEYEEIGQIVGVEIGTVKSRIARARKNLWAGITAECPSLESIRNTVNL